MMSLLNRMKAEALNVSMQQGQHRWGIVTSARETKDGYEVRVKLQPDDVLSGWLPVLSPMVGQGWGIVSPPALGMQAFVAPDMGFHEHGVVLGMSFSTTNPPPMPGGKSVKPGEFALVHSNGSYLHFDADDVHVVTNRDLLSKVGRNLIATVSQDATIQAAQQINLTAPAISSDADGKGGAGTWNIQGDVHVNGDVYDKHGSLDRLRGNHNNHTHVDTRGDGVPAPNTGIDPE